MKKLTAFWLAVWMLVAMTAMPISAAELDIPMVEYEGEMYYDLSGKEDYFRAVRYGLDNRLTSVPVRFERSRFPEYETDRMWFNSVSSFDYTQDDLYYTYDRYSPSTVCMMPYRSDFVNNVDHGQIEITYIDSAEELQKADAMLDAELAKVSTYSKKDKIRYVAEFICRTVDAGFQEMPGGGYDTINGVYDLMTGVRTNVVCSSFAFLFQRFMERAGYPCYIATGVNHAWNVVELDGKWYGVDCTYADEGTVMDESCFLMGMDRLKGYISETENVFAEMETELGCRFAQLGYGVVPTTTTVRTTTTTAATTTRPTTTSAKAAVTTTKKSTAPTTVKTTAMTTTTTTTEAASTTATTTMTQAASVQLDLSVNAQVEAEVFANLANGGKELVLKGEGYQWTFTADKLSQEAVSAPLNTAVLLGEAVSEQEKETVEKLSKGEKIFPFSFAHHGELPGEATICLQVADEFAGKAVAIYSVNEAGEAVLEARATVSIGGQLTFTTDHCSLWFIQAESEGGAGVFPYIAIGAAVLIAALAVVLALKKRKEKATQ